MHRTIEVTFSPDCPDIALKELEDLDHVVGLSVQRQASVKPPGDVVTVHVLNRGADDVLRVAESARDHGDVSVVTSEVASIVDPRHADAVSNDVDEALWEEVESGLRHQGRVTPNYLTLMALGGAIAAVGLVSDPVPQALAFVSASIIAPGFEPLAKVPVGLVLGRPNVVRRGVLASLAGYATLVAGAAVAFGVMRLFGGVTPDELVANPEVHRIAHQHLGDLLVSVAAAVAGLTMMVAYRRTVIAGPLVALVLVPAAALVGAALVAGEAGLAAEGAQRLAIDAALVVGLGAAVVAAKQAGVHRRRPMV